jgi:hypothetical protein
LGDEGSKAHGKVDLPLHRTTSGRYTCRGDGSISGMVGVTDGDKEGVRVGVGEGVRDGVRVGVTDGVREGVTDGIRVGVRVGVEEGVTDGVGVAVLLFVCCTTIVSLAS